MAECSQPGWSIIARIRAVVSCENSPDNIFVEFQSECQIDLLCDSRAAEAMVASFHFDYGINDFPCRFFGHRFASTEW